MAACTFKVGTADTGNTPNTSGAFTPAAGDLLVVFLAATVTAEDPATLTSSAGLTFTQIARETYSGTTNSHYLFVSNEAAAASSQTVSFSPVDTATGTLICVFSVSGMTKLGATAVRQFATEKSPSGAPTNAPEPIFSLSAITTNPTLGAVACSTNTPTLTAPTGWTEPAGGDIGHVTPDSGIEVCSRDSGFTGTNIQWGTVPATQFAAIIVELDASSAGSIVPILNQYRFRRA